MKFYNKKRFFRRICLPLALTLSLTWLLAGCEAGNGAKNGPENKQGIVVVATLFPQYDFAREIVGDLGTVELLLDPGMESHSFDPTTADMKRINEADVFLYTGPELETWVAQISDSFSEDLLVADLSSGILEEIEGAAEENDREAAQDGEADGHHHDVDPHIWTNPRYAIRMVEQIRDVLCEADPDHAESYMQNAQAYLTELENLDRAFEEAVQSGKRKEIVHGGRFALYHFAKRYGLSWKAAYDSCSAQMEPSAKTIAALTEEVKEKEIPVIFYEELVEPTVARSISEETGAKMLLFHSCHNVSASEFKEGANYLDLMKKNLENLKTALN